MTEEAAVNNLDSLALLEDYYNLAVFAFFLNEKEIKDKIDFEIEYAKAEQEFDSIEGEADFSQKARMQRYVNEKQLRFYQAEQKVARNGRVLFKSFTIFMMQFVMCLLILQYFWTMQTVVVPPFFHCSVVQKICLLYLHLQMQPKVSQALEALVFIIEHPYNFSNLISPILICLMNMTTILMTQIAGFVVCITTDDANGVIGGFVAFSVISELPAQYFQAISVDELKREMDTAEDQKVIRAKRHLFKYKANQMNQGFRSSNLLIQVEGEDQPRELQEGDTEFIQSVQGHIWWVSCFWYLAALIKQVYEIFYFYFAPFSMIVFQFIYIAYFNKAKSFTPKPVAEAEDASL